MANENFFKQFKEELEKILPEGYELKYPKIAGRENPVMLTKKDKRDIEMYPTGYVTDELIKAWETEGRTIEEAAKEFLQVLLEECNNPPFLDVKSLFSETTGIIPCLMKKAGNEEKIKKIPHRDFFDMVIYYRKLVGDTGSFVITNEHMDFPITVYNSEEDLFNLSMINVRDYNIGFIEILFPIAFFMGEECTWGANILLCPNKLDVVAKELGLEKIYISPITCHEVNILPEITEEFITEHKQIVADMLKEQIIIKKDFLTGSIFCYDSKIKELTLVERGNF